MKMKSRFSSVLALTLTLFLFFAPCAPSSGSEAVSQPIDKGIDETTTPVDKLPELDHAAPIPYKSDLGDGPVYIFLTRHGETLSNAAGRLVCGLGNTPLTESGREVARYLGVGLQDVYFKAVYSSNLNRTHETASIILAENQTASRHYEIRQHAGMREPGLGDYEGYLYSEIAKLGVDMRITKKMLDDIHKLDPAAEDYAQFLNRTWAAINEICQKETKNGGGNVLVVAHALSNATIARNISYPDSRSLLRNSSIVLLKYEKGNLELLSYNDMGYVDKGKAMIESPEPVTMNLVVTAQTREDTRGRFSSVMDSDLTEAGEAAARALGAKLAPKGFRAVYSSDLWKDVNTAKAMIAGSGNRRLTVHSSRDLRGVQAGFYESEKMEKLPQAAGTTAKDRITSFHENDPKKIAEDYESAKSHVLSAYRAVCEQVRGTGGGEIAIVASGLTQQLAVEELTGTALKAPLKPGDVVTLLYDGTGYKLK